MFKTDKILLSHYTASYDDYGKNDEKQVPSICQSFFNERGMISFLGAETMDMSARDFLETPYIAGGMMFSTGKILTDVPFDPHLDYLFVGEEISHSIRCWTHGYRIFTPMTNVVFHFYTRENDPKIWTDKKYTDTDAFRKVKMMIGLEDPNWGELPDKYKTNLELYGLGKERTLKEYYEFAGIDIKNKKVVKNFCRENLMADEVKIEENNVMLKNALLLAMAGFGIYYIYRNRGG
jgi:hypothetical protein